MPEAEKENNAFHRTVKGESSIFETKHFIIYLHMHVRFESMRILKVENFCALDGKRRHNTTTFAGKAHFWRIDKPRRLYRPFFFTLLQPFSFFFANFFHILVRKLVTCCRNSRCSSEILNDVPNKCMRRSPGRMHFKIILHWCCTSTAL